MYEEKRLEEELLKKDLEAKKLQEQKDKEESERLAQEVAQREQKHVQEVDSQPRTTILQPLSSTTVVSSSTQVFTTLVAPTWLKLDLERKQIVKPQPLNWDEMMKEIEKERPKKKFRVLHSTMLTNAGEIVVECAIPMVDKDKQDMQLTNYQLGTANLGRPTRNQ